MGALITAAAVGFVNLATCAAEQGAAKPDWAGLYIGAHLGYGWGDASADWSAVAPSGGVILGPAPAPLAGTIEFSPSGFVGGAQVGYNFVSGPWVFGLEGTISGGDIRETSIYEHPAIPPGLTVSTTADYRWLATFTPRIGYSWDRWLAYVKGGYAIAAVTASGTASGSVFGSPVNVSIDHRERVDGWIIGAGGEYALSENLSVGLEYDYMDFGNKGISGAIVTPGGTATYQAELSGHVHMIAARLNLRLN